MTAAEAVKFVKRPVPKTKDGKPVLDDDGNPTIEEVAIKEDEVLGFRDYGDHVVVVTKDGKKFRGDKKK